MTPQEANHWAAQLAEVFRHHPRLKWQVLASQGMEIERELRADIERLRAEISSLQATIASGKLDPAQVWPS